jgi:hypothetical protein
MVQLLGDLATSATALMLAPRVPSARWLTLDVMSRLATVAEYKVAPMWLMIATSVKVYSSAQMQPC